MGWTLTLRVGPEVRSERFSTLGEALDALETRLDEQDGRTRRGPARVGLRQVEPVRQVAARAEVSGPKRLLPRIVLGLDVRGDGSAEAYTGRVRKQVVKPRPGESPLQALRRVGAGQRAGGGSSGSGAS